MQLKSAASVQNSYPSLKMAREGPPWQTLTLRATEEPWSCLFWVFASFSPGKDKHKGKQETTITMAAKRRDQ